MKNHDPITPANMVRNWDDKKDCLQNCIAENTKIADRKEITKESEVWTAVEELVTVRYSFGTFFYFVFIYLPIFLATISTKSFFLRREIHTQFKNPVKINPQILVLSVVVSIFFVDSFIYSNKNFVCWVFSSWLTT